MKTKLFTLLFCFLSSFLLGNENLLKDEWKLFSQEHPSLKHLTSLEVSVLADTWGETVAKQLSLKQPLRKIDPNILEKIEVLLQEKHPQIAMRHGEQQKALGIDALSGPMQKIEMMRLPNNLEDPLTQHSLAEWMKGLIVWEYLRQKTGVSFILETSQNQRAWIPASLLGLIWDIEPQETPTLNCVNYPSSTTLSNATLLEWIPDGTLPWQKQKVDLVIAPGTYDFVQHTMQEWIKQKHAHAVPFAVTHTQQMNALSCLSGLPVLRLDYFGLIILTETSQEIFPSGFYIVD